MAKVFLPKDTMDVWETVRVEAQSSDSNLHSGLLFYKFMEPGKPKEEFTEGLRRVCERADLQTVHDLLERQKRVMSELKRQGFAVDQWSQELISRMAAGLGIPSITKNGIAVDHTHGVPYIPGSILKGIAQDYALYWEHNGGTDAALGRSKKSEPLFVAVFGAQTPEKGEAEDAFQTRKGGVIFFDALLEKWKAPDPEAPTPGAPTPFEVDVMNPHYQEYYSSAGKSPPADYLNPKPIKFLTVKDGTRFFFSLAARKAEMPAGTPSGSELVAKAGTWLACALQEMGAGGKTRVGYGVFGERIEAA